MATTIKLDANFNDEVIDLAALGYTAYDVVKVTLKGAYRNDGMGKDNYHDVQLVYHGEVDAPLDTKLTVLLDDNSLTMTLFTNDPIVGGNTDPNQDFRVVIEAGLYSDDNDIVDFSNLSAMQAKAVKNGAALYNSRGGDDEIKLPDKGEIKGYDFDRIFTSGVGNDTVYGGNADDKLDGGGGGNALFGMGGNDKLFSHAIGDSLLGGAGRDTFFGNGDGDNFTGGGGRDLFVYKKFSDSINTFDGLDYYSDFSQSDGDILDFSAIDARPGGGNDKFTFIGTDDFSHKGGEIRYEVFSGYTMLQLSRDEDAAEMEIRFEGEYNFKKGDFVL